MSTPTTPRHRLGPVVATAAVPAVTLAYGVAAVLQRVHAAHVGHVGHVGDGGSAVLGWLRDGTLALPLAALVVLAAPVAAGVVARAAGRADDSAAAALIRVLLTATTYALAVVPAGQVRALLAPSGTGTGTGTRTVALDAGLALLTGLVVLVAAQLLVDGAAGLRSSGHVGVRRARRVALVSLTGGALVLGMTPAQGATDAQVPATPATQAAVAACDAAGADRTYDIAAINVDIPYNRWGQRNPHGMVYALQADKVAIRDWSRPLGTTSSDRRLRPRPLVVRANEGECVRVNFSNELGERPGPGLPVNPRASISIKGLPYDVQTSGGSHVGYNEDTTVGRGQTITSYWRAPQEGTYFFQDTAMPAGSEGDGGSAAHGLFGALVVEPAGSTWSDPRTGRPLYTGTGTQSGDLYLDAVIDPPTGRTFRETVQLAQDEMPVTSGFGFNYGSEPIGLRNDERCGDCVGEETSLSSWAYGDPALVKLASGLGPWEPGTAAAAESCGLDRPGFDADSCFTSNVVHAYSADPIKFRYGMAGGRETHVFHMHAHTWLADDKDTGAAGPTPSTPSATAQAESQTIDSQTFGPNEMFTADLLFGAGSRPGTIGDSIFHCHLYPHFADGFWAMFRVHDVLEDGTGTTPDGIRVPTLLALAAVTGQAGEPAAPPAPTADNPGYPRFIPGEVGWRAPQPPLGVKDAGALAPRFVAGARLDEQSAAVAVETAVRNRLSGGASKPGAPFRDPCPTGSREVTYKVSAIQTDIVYNERGDHDTQGRILVLDSDVDAVLAGTKAPEPLFARVNAGDCVTWELTNRLPNWFGADAFQQLTQTNMFGQHIHLVKFDVLASDGASNGWNYQQAAFSRVQADFNAATAAGAEGCTVADCRLELPTSYSPTTTSKGLAPGQTIVERWYADYELRTVFTHDHHFAAVDQNRGLYGAVVVEPAGTDFRDPRTGAFLSPATAAGRGIPRCGTACEGKAVGAVLDVIGPGADDDFRDFGLAIADFVSLTRKGGDPRTRAGTINPPAAPEELPSEDPGVMAINYRNAPLELRRTKNGTTVDPAYSFSSTVFGDPRTPVLQTYAGDNVRIRLIQGSHEEQHQMLIHGQKWREEPDDPQSPMVDAVPVGVSEAFNFEVPRMNCAVGQDCRGDFLYSGAGLDDVSTGAWGILRVNGGTVPGLKALPDNVPTRAGSVPAKSATAVAAPAATTPGTPCAAGAPVRRYSVVAMQARITYNGAGDHDPYGLVYALASDEAAIRAGRNPDPLVLRANEGDCIEVTLTNRLTTALLQHRGPADGDAPAPNESTAARTMGLRVSMHPGLLSYDVRGSDGAAIGYNKDSTVAPGRSYTYRWFADDVTPGEIGGVNITDFGDVRGHRHHGLFAGLVVEPKGSTWHDPATGRPLLSGANADIRVPGRPDFRESVVQYSDGLNLRTRTGAIIADPGADLEPGDALDVEDRGEKAFGYRNEPFRHRLGYEPVRNVAPDGRAMADVYDSHRHGDPATTMMRAYAGDELRVRILQGSDKPRQHAFSLDGHGFRLQPDDPGGRTVGTASGISVGTAINAQMGVTGVPGDYLYADQVAGWNRSAGLWGMLRVYPRPAAGTALLPTPLTGVDDPRAGGHPLLPLELDTVQADVFRDLDADGVHDAGEVAVAGATVSLTTAGTVLARGSSGPDGQAHVSVPAGSYGVTVTPPTGFRLTKAPATVVTAGNNATRKIAVGLRTP